VPNARGETTWEGAVEIKVNLLRDAAEAVDITVESLRKLIDLLFDTGAKGREVLSAAQERRLTNALQKIHACAISLGADSVVGMRTSIENFCHHPSATRWREVQAEAGAMLEAVAEIREALDDNASKLSTMEFYGPLLATLVQRELLFSELVKMKDPPSGADLRELKRFSEKYIKLINALCTVNAAFTDYMRRRAK
jgi:uncharacterized protein YbjQ (UPF0145 family)